MTHPFMAYPAIGAHSVTGDRRTALLVAADGTIDWLCLPNYDSVSIFGTLLDAERGGFWRLGPDQRRSGRQRYRSHSPAVTTIWATPTDTWEVTDLMAWPQDKRHPDDERRRVILRRIQCRQGHPLCAMTLMPRADFHQTARFRQTSNTGVSMTLDTVSLSLWTSFPVELEAHQVNATLPLQAGDVHWAVLTLDEAPDGWNRQCAEQLFTETKRYWRGWMRRLTPPAARKRTLLRSAMIIHLLDFAPDGSLVAAPTTSLPERIGGDKNYDYRYTWVRDASLAVTGLSLLGDQATPRRYLEWMVKRHSTSPMPLQVAYQIDGAAHLTQVERADLAGYRESPPVRVGNRAASQVQPGALGYLADCMLMYLEHGGQWRQAYWDLLTHCADYIAQHWQETDNGIWELATRAHYVSSKVMSWVVLDRAARIAQRLALPAPAAWQQAQARIHADVLQRGWSEQQHSFIQRYDAETLDASVLLMPIMGFLPARHPQVQQTITRIAADLTSDGLVYRFQPETTPASHPLPLGEFEGAFLPCTFWLASAYARAGQVAEAEAVLSRAERIAGPSGLFAEEADPRTGEMLGNYPLLFSQVEYLRAVLTLAQANHS